MKKLVKVIATVTMVTTMFASTASAVKMYSPDGRSVSVMESDVAAWKAKGWHTENYKKLYAPDGRTSKVLLADVEGWKKVGWYEYPVTTVYSLSGKSQVIAKDAVKDWKKVGWYLATDTRTMYTLDGRTEAVAIKDIAAWKKVGWYEYPVTTVYTPEGKTKIIAKSDVESWKKVGWLDEIGYDYNNVKNTCNNYVSNGSYESALSYIDSWQSYFYGTSQSYSLKLLKEGIMNKWRAKIKYPLAYTGNHYMDGSNVYIEFRNISYKPIIAFRLTYDCYDVFNDYQESYYDYYYIKNIYLDSGESAYYYWYPGAGSDVHHIKNVKITEVVFADGTEA